MWLLTLARLTRGLILTPLPTPIIAPVIRGRNWIMTNMTSYEHLILPIMGQVLGRMSERYCVLFCDGLKFEIELNWGDTEQDDVMFMWHCFCGESERRAQPEATNAKALYYNWQTNEITCRVMTCCLLINYIATNIHTLLTVLSNVRNAPGKNRITTTKQRRCDHKLMYLQLTSWRPCRTPSSRFVSLCDSLRLFVLFFNWFRRDLQDRISAESTAGQL